MREARHLFLQNVPVYRCSEMGQKQGLKAVRQNLGES